MTFVNSEEDFKALLKDLFLKTQLNNMVKGKAAGDNFDKISEVVSLNKIAENLALDCFAQNLQTPEAETLRNCFFRYNHLDHAFFGPYSPDYVDV